MPPANEPNIQVGHFLPGQKTKSDASPRRGLDFSSIIAPEVRFELYNPDPDEPIYESFAAEMYVIPPSTQRLVTLDPFSHEQSVYPKPGVCPIFDRNERRGFPIPAQKIVEHFCGTDGRSGTIGGRGVRPLFGDERDQAVIAEAKEAFLRFRDQEDLVMIRDHENRVMIARENATPPPRPTPQVMAAYQRSAQRDETNLFKFSCEVCNGPFATEQEMLVHVVSVHKKHPAAVEAVRALKLDQQNPKPEFVPPEPKGKLPTQEEVEGALDEAEGKLENSKPAPGQIPPTRPIQGGPPKK